MWVCHPLIHKVMTLLDMENDAEEVFTKENPETFQRWMLIKIFTPLITFC